MPQHQVEKTIKIKLTQDTITSVQKIIQVNYNTTQRTAIYMSHSTMSLQVNHIRQVKLNLYKHLHNPIQIKMILHYLQLIRNSSPPQHRRNLTVQWNDKLHTITIHATVTLTPIYSLCLLLVHIPSYIYYSHTTHYTLHTTYYTLHTTHYILHTTYYT